MQSHIGLSETSSQSAVNELEKIDNLISKILVDELVVRIHAEADSTLAGPPLPYKELLVALNECDDAQLERIKDKHLTFLQGERVVKGTNMLHIACNKGFIRIAKWLIDKEIIDPRKPSKKSSTLKYAFSKDHYALAKELISSYNSMRESLYAENLFAITLEDYLKLKKDIKDPSCDSDLVQFFQKKLDKMEDENIIPFLLAQGAGIGIDLREFEELDLPLDLPPSICIGAQLPVGDYDHLILTAEQLKDVLEVEEIDKEALYHAIQYRLKEYAAAQPQQADHTPLEKPAHIKELELAFNLLRVPSLKNLLHHSIFNLSNQGHVFDLDKLPIELQQEHAEFRARVSK